MIFSFNLCFWEMRVDDFGWINFVAFCFGSSTFILFNGILVSVGVFVVTYIYWLVLGFWNVFYEGCGC